MLSVIAQHWRIAVQLARIGLVRKSQFRVELLSQIVMDTFWYGAHVATFEVFYTHTPTIAGWSREAFRVLLAYLFVSDAIMMIWLSASWRFGRDLKAGELDYYRTRPASILFTYMFQYFSVEGCVNMLMAGSYLVYAIAQATPAFTAELCIRALVALLLSFWVRVVITTMFAIPELWFVGSDASAFFRDLFHSAADRPVDIFAARTRGFLLYVVPIGALSQLPAAIALGRYTPFESLLSVAWLVALGLALFALWAWSFRRYESAMG
jgi:ABC-2 type transport system permease protein